MTAFWPFSGARAADDSEPPLIHDTTVAYLEADMNPNAALGSYSLAMTDDSALLPGSMGGGDALPAVAGASASADAITTYEVHEGDSVSEIADMFGVSVNTILWANDIKDSATIQPGDTLRILPVSGVMYTVKRGGTLSDIAELFEVEVEELVAANGLAASESLAAGTEILVPGGTAVSKKSAPKSSSSSSVAVVKKTLPTLSGYFGNPVPGAKLTQGIHGHNGVDLGAPAGTAVYAAAGGTVIAAEVGTYNGGYGNYVDITHDNGTVTRYAHLSSVSVATGQAVEKGEKIGGVGNTGRSTGYHLHFEVRGAKNPFAN